MNLFGLTIIRAISELQPIEAVTEKIKDMKKSGIVVIARTGAILVGAPKGGVEEAIRRLKAFGDAGADLIFPSSGGLTLEHLKKIRKEVDARLYLQFVPSFRAEREEVYRGSPWHLSWDELFDLGVQVINFPEVQRTVYRAAWNALSKIGKARTLSVIKDIWPSWDNWEEVEGYMDAPTIRRKYGKYGNCPT